MLSERSANDAWDNLKRQTHMVDIESGLLGVMAEAQEKGYLPPAVVTHPEPVAPAEETGPIQYNLGLLGLEGSETAEGAMADIYLLDQSLDMVLAVEGDLFVVVSMQINKDHALALLRLYNASQAAEEGSEEALAYAGALWHAFELMIDGLYSALRGDA